MSKIVIDHAYATGVNLEGQPVNTKVEEDITDSLPTDLCQEMDTNREDINELCDAKNDSAQVTENCSSLFSQTQSEDKLIFATICDKTEQKSQHKKISGKNELWENALLKKAMSEIETLKRALKKCEAEKKALFENEVLQRVIKENATFRGALRKVFHEDQIKVLIEDVERPQRWTDFTLNKSLQIKHVVGSAGISCSSFSRLVHNILFFCILKAMKCLETLDILFLANHHSPNFRREIILNREFLKK